MKRHTLFAVVTSVVTAIVMLMVGGGAASADIQGPGVHQITLTCPDGTFAGVSTGPAPIVQVTTSTRVFVAVGLHAPQGFSGAARTETCGIMDVTTGTSGTDVWLVTGAP